MRAKTQIVRRNKTRDTDYVSTPLKIKNNQLNKIMKMNRNPNFINLDDPKELEEGAAVRL